MSKFQLIAKQFDEHAFYLWMKDNTELIKRFDWLERHIFYYTFSKSFCDDPAGSIFYRSELEIRHKTLIELKQYPNLINEYNDLRNELAKAWIDFNVPRWFVMDYWSCPACEKEGDIEIDYDSIFIDSNTKQSLQARIDYVKFALKVIPNIFKIKGSVKLRHMDDIVCEYDIFGNLIYKGLYKDSNWHKLENSRATKHSSSDSRCDKQECTVYNKRLGIHFICVTNEYRKKLNIPGYPSNANLLYTDLYNLIGYGVVLEYGHDENIVLRLM